MKTYKGFNKDMTCKGFQYEEGKEYTQDKAKVRETGFHACKYPLDCFSHYEPWNSVYHEVEQTGEIDESNTNDTKVSSSKIKIGARIDIAGLVKAAIEYTMERIKPEAKSTGYKGASSATGDFGASSATGDFGASSATGYKGASSATGDFGASSATGNCGASSATGYKGSAIAGDPDSIAIAWGYHGKAKGVKGSYLVLADWNGNEKNYWTQNEWSLNGAKMVRVDGVNIKENVYYTMVDGEIVEAE
jgi:hypothetical protein